MSTPSLAELAYTAGTIGGLPWDSLDARTRAHWARIAEAVRVGARESFIAELEHAQVQLERLAASGAVSPTQVWHGGKVPGKR